MQNPTSATSPTAAKRQLILRICIMQKPVLAVPAAVEPTSVQQLFILRMCIMLSYSMTYVAVPALLFQGTRSTLIAGSALLAEGLLRAVFSLYVRKVHGALGSSRAMRVAELARVVGALGILVCLWKFNIAVLVLSSATYQFGYLLVVMEQELRCGVLGDKIPECQSKYRLAEVLAVFPVLAAAIGFALFKSPMLPMVLLGAAFALGHGALCRLWLKTDVSDKAAPGQALAGLRALVADKVLARGLIISTMMLSVFALTLSAAPFLLAGKDIFGVDLTKQAGLAMFKTLAAVMALAAVLLMTRMMKTRSARWCINGAAVLSPILAGASTFVNSGELASLLLASGAGVALSALMAHRSIRQQRLSVGKRSDVTAAYLAIECLSLSIAGLMLLTGWVAAVMALVAIGMLVLQSLSASREAVVPGVALR